MIKYSHFHSSVWQNIYVIEAFVCPLYLPLQKIDECSRCKLATFQEETGAIWGAPPLKLHFIQL